MSNTPMMQQYKDIKNKHQDAVLFFRMGDFYEMFLEDAVEVSQILGIALTQRQGIPMCGIPYHSTTNYLRRLLNQGYKVAICEQIESSGKERGLMQRQVVETLSPGTVIDESFLERHCNNYLLALHYTQATVSASYIDLSTGEFYASAFPYSSNSEREEIIRAQILRLNPREMIVAESQQHTLKPYITATEAVNCFPNWYFEPHQANEVLCRHLAVSSLKGFDFQENDPCLGAAAVILKYVEESSPKLLNNITVLKKTTNQHLLQIDSATLRNLEIVTNLQDGSTEYTLCRVMNTALTAMGSRCLRRWLLQPLANKEQINQRLDLVEQLTHQALQHNLVIALKRTPDLERLVSRLNTDRAHARDILAVAQSLNSLDKIAGLVAGYPLADSLIQSCNLKDLRQIETLIGTAIAPEAAVNFGEGHVIAPGYHQELDALREQQQNREHILDDYLTQERQQSGIGNLKLKNNRLIGYFFEISRNKQAHIPTHFIRRQSMATCERFSTDRLVELEQQLEQTGEKLLQLEQQLFQQLCCKLKQQTAQLRQAASTLAQLDALLAFATRAARSDYQRPQIYPDQRLRIQDGRHPVVEHYLDSGQFVANNLNLSAKQRFVLLTGPNMAGKSTFLRQNALIVYLAQCGSFVPASSAEIGIADRIFCRVGASDNLARGESTFMIEMQECARILNLASEKSLVIMDEVGRGTSTEDGLALARSISEYLLERLGSRTLFATHYHQLTKMKHPRLDNFTIAVDDSQNPILFLRKIISGAARSSYGLHVAALAGIPEPVIYRAQQLLAPAQAAKSPELPYFQPHQLQQELDRLDLNNLTPLAALTCLSEWKKLFGSEQYPQHEQ